MRRDAWNSGAGDGSEGQRSFDLASDALSPVFLPHSTFFLPSKSSSLVPQHATTRRSPSQPAVVPDSAGILAAASHPSCPNGSHVALRSRRLHARNDPLPRSSPSADLLVRRVLGRRRS